LSDLPAFQPRAKLMWGRRCHLQLDGGLMSLVDEVEWRGDATTGPRPHHFAGEENAGLPAATE
jgi:hypothetical protein